MIMTIITTIIIMVIIAKAYRQYFSFHMAGWNGLGRYGCK